MNRCSRANPDKCRVDAIEFEDLNTIEPGEAEEAEGSQEGQSKEPLGKAEETVLSLVIAGGYTSREELAKKCDDVGLEVSKRSVSRLLKTLTEQGLLTRVGNGYEPTELTRKLSRPEIL